MEKYFIISLPRTGTTSTCAFMLNLGFKVAHTAFNQSVFEQAEVIADTPVFVDYPSLHKRYPQAKFIFIERNLNDWAPSIQRLLRSMRKRLSKDRLAFHPEILRCFESVFPKFYTPSVLLDDDYVSQCHTKHQAQVNDYFITKSSLLLRVNIEENDISNILSEFTNRHINKGSALPFPHINKDRKICFWDDISHENKIDSMHK